MLSLISARKLAGYKEVFAMPTYDFMCQKCEKPFTLVMTISEYNNKKFRCPKCKSTKVKQQISSFQVVTSKKS
jgi:putative FmdB family regulatory protein